MIRRITLTLNQNIQDFLFTVLESMRTASDEGKELMNRQKEVVTRSSCDRIPFEKVDFVQDNTCTFSHCTQGIVRHMDGKASLFCN